MDPTAPLADTIAAIATAVVPEQGSVGIVRLSGSRALPIVQAIFTPARRNAVWESHRLLYGWIRDEKGQILDEALAVWMQAPRSYTREDVAELHCHGGIMVVQATLQQCLRQGARLAQPGEFSLRAFLNGRIDLTQAESVADLVAARSPQAARMALAGLQGKLGGSIRALRQELLGLLAEIEARLDFEEDLPPLDVAAWQARLQAIQTQIQALLATAERGQLLRTGVKVAIVGRPNVGKSSLLNAWSGQDRAIVTDLPGTTRDVVESHLVVKGIPVQLLDTAGIRATEDPVERLGVERSQRLAQAADVLVLVIDAQAGWTAADAAIYESIRHRPLILVINKTDLAPPEGIPLPPEIAHRVPAVAAQGKGIPELEEALEQLVTQGRPQPNLEISLNQRQAAALQQAQASLEQVGQAIQAQLPLDFWSIDLRGALHALGQITGEEISESVLDQIFSRFCIGK
ncbi:tRNA modification GTPase TrmE [Synechococcus sp. JA-2-3B'a(2-13)]|uniref:tRNA modification GTPase MnmE n=1 Tax=Synechococcus sp. (strain JA-2-3B'a(2-13)) TaxID=321332 RepID=MNME_SYNJB|nr:tRNA uridine-5-carboxymethylaminomethyl(34) synthesis GTPase MnmE [Synechococcus sp. JA-2-3B'a(2-13)]Q2JIE6.1 RecName: Full=tRNA modification GTPase MnmE [Synechococcus sp. JA-2-3B'a(2-13)]ABD03613.1 tRNA modification GTPase TrmE [Synechococcus sp. JA-2-3B'a(2-13)]